MKRLFTIELKIVNVLNFIWKKHQYSIILSPIMRKKLNTNKIKILLVDKDNTDCLLFQNKIEQSTKPDHYIIDVVHTYADAMAAITEKEHDIYFIDFMLNTENGMSLIEDAITNDNNGPFVLLAGTDRPELYQKSSKSGVSEYLLKNEITPSALERTITYTLERNNIYSELMNEKNLVQNIIQEAPYIVMRIDYAGFIQSINPAFTKITHYSDDEIQGLNWGDIIVQNDLHFIQKAIENNSVESFRTNIICKNQTNKIVEWNILHNANEGLSLSVIGKDITSELEKEDKNRRQDKMQALGHLAGGVAHEINNLLQPIILNAEWINDENPSDNITEAAQDIITNSQIASSIVEDILIFARQDRKYLENLNFLDTFHEAQNVAKNMLPKTISVDTINHSVSPESCCLFRLKDMVRILSNLLLNASYAMNKTGVITIELYQNDNHIRLDVTDTGYGISQENLETIFNPFFTTKDIGEGTGLGLTMVYNIVKNWDATLNVESSEGDGSCFSITIPITHS